MFCSYFSQNPELYFTSSLYTCIYYTVGCAARAADARFPWTRVRAFLIGLARILID